MVFAIPGIRHMVQCTSRPLQGFSAGLSPRVLPTNLLHAPLRASLIICTLLERITLSLTLASQVHHMHILRTVHIHHRSLLAPILPPSIPPSRQASWKCRRQRNYSNLGLGSSSFFLNLYSAIYSASSQYSTAPCLTD